ncbi:5754_t:CDS:2, partial [Gigaspora margarita]
MNEICETVTSQKEKIKLNIHGHAITVYSNGSHFFKKTAKHKHSLQASTKETRNSPAQIIQNNTVAVDENLVSSMPSKEALRMRIKHIRRSEMPPQPQTLDEVNVPLPFQYTLKRELFLIRDSQVGLGQVLIFTTKTNVQCLSQASFWVMDGTFRTVPTVFHQLYTIHAPIGTSENSQIFLLVYALMSSKLAELYMQLFQDLNDFAAENEFTL